MGRKIRDFHAFLLPRIAISDRHGFVIAADECYSEVPQSMTIRLQGEYGNIYLRCSYCEDRRTPTEYPEDEE